MIIISKGSMEVAKVMFVNCQASLVESFPRWFSDEFAFDGNRGILLDVTEDFPTKPLTICIAAALNYHLDRRTRQRGLV